MIPGYLPETIEILKNGRAKLVGDVISHNRYDIFKWLFRHEKNPHGQRMVFDKYFIEWINFQLQKAFSISNEVGCIVVGLLSPLIEERASIEKESANAVKEIIPQLLSEKVAILKQFMHVEDLTESRINQIESMMERDNALFNRSLEELSGIY
jgi:hypothetical protein